MEPYLDMTFCRTGERVDHDGENVWQKQVRGVRNTPCRCLVLEVDLVKESGVSREPGE